MGRSIPEQGDLNSPFMQKITDTFGCGVADYLDFPTVTRLFYRLGNSRNIRYTQREIASTSGILRIKSKAVW